MTTDEPEDAILEVAPSDGLIRESDNLDQSEIDKEAADPPASRESAHERQGELRHTEEDWTDWLSGPPQTEPPLPLQPDSREVNFPMSFDELCELARHWFGVIHEYALWSFYTAQCPGGRYRRGLAHAGLDRIAGVIGEEGVQKVREQVDAKLRWQMGPERFEIYQHGDDAAWIRVAHETHESSEYLEVKLKDESLRARAMAHLRANPTGTFVDADNDLWSLSPAREGDRLRLFLVSRCHGSAPADATIERPLGWVAPTWFNTPGM